MTKVEQRRVILITDGDHVACRVIEKLVSQMGGRCISSSSGNPTLLSGKEIVSRVLQTPYDPVLIMFDDNGKAGTGFGEHALKYVARHPQIKVLGALAVASETRWARGVAIDYSVDSEGNKISSGVDKLGQPHMDGSKLVYGDTVEALTGLNIPIIIGIGDIGKMDGHDVLRFGAKVTRKALQIIMDHQEVY